MANNGWVSSVFAELIEQGLLTIGDGYRAKNKELGGAGLIFLRAGHVTDSTIDFSGVERFREELSQRVAPKVSRAGDAVITTKGNSTGRVTFIREGLPPFVYSPHLSYWRSCDPARLVPRFLYYWSRSTEFRTQLRGMSASTDMAPYLSLQDQRRLRITLPPPGFQVRVAEILGSLDDKIELNRRMNETLEGVARAIFKSWFVDFDPVRAKAAGRKPAGLDAATAALFPAALEKSAFGEIPKGWKNAHLSEHIEATKGLSYKGSGLAESGLPLHNLNSVYEGGGYKFHGIKRYTGEYRERHLIQSGDVVVANTEQGHDCLLLGYAAIVPSTFGQPALYSHHLYRLRIREGSPLTADFLCRLLNSPQMHDLVSGYGNGTTVNMLPIDGLQHPTFTVPPAKLIKQFTEFASAARTRCERLVAENKQLAAIRDALLPKLLSGELRVPDAEKIVEEVA